MKVVMVNVLLRFDVKWKENNADFMFFLCFCRKKNT